ncbi:MAG: DUF421 domain-containing protein [Roseiflexaceae bacterium]
MFDLDWGHILLPDTPLLEIFIRGTLMYLALFVMLRIVLRRQSGTVGITDLLVVVLLADASQNAMADDYHSIADGVLLVATIIGWSYALDWLGYHIPVVQRFVHPPPLTLVQDGQMQRRNMRKELITAEELMTQLREQGIESLDQVKRACMEGDGQISVVKHEDASGSEPGKKRRVAT